MRADLVTPVRRRWIGRLALALVCAALLASLPSSSGQSDSARSMTLRRELAEVRARTEARRADNRRLRREIAALKTDPRAIESAARDQLGMVYDNEVVIRIVEGEQ